MINPLSEKHPSFLVEESVRRRFARDVEACEARLADAKKGDSHGCFSCAHYRLPILHKDSKSNGEGPWTHEAMWVFCESYTTDMQVQSFCPRYQAYEEGKIFEV